MTKIVLVCNAGISNSLLVAHMVEESKNKEGDFEIIACPANEVKEKATNADVVLLAPQVAFERETVSQQVNCPVEVINSGAYANLDGLAVIEYAIKLSKK